jgi:tripartite-type tricarboxylate transporter receptor subunit TctC
MGISAIASIGSAAALDYPTRPVRWVVGYPPGGATDIIARLLGQRLSERIGQQFVIENKPGAGNNIANESVIEADLDGYTLLFVNPANYINASLYTNLKFNVVRDLAPIAAFNRVPNVMTVNKEPKPRNGRRWSRPPACTSIEARPEPSAGSRCFENEATRQRV